MVATLSAAILSDRSCQRHRTNILMATTRFEGSRAHIGVLIVDDENWDAFALIGF